MTKPRLAFRNLTASPSDPVSTWPTEAVQAALERGDLPDWRRVAVEIEAAPWGRTSRQVEEVLSHSRPYGVTELMGSVIARARTLAEQDERAAVAARIRSAVRRSGLTQAQFAAAIGTSASRLSTYANAAVMPSAAMLVRIERFSAR